MKTNLRRSSIHAAGAFLVVCSMFYASTSVWTHAQEGEPVVDESAQTSENNEITITTENNIVTEGTNTSDCGCSSAASSEQTSSASSESVVSSTPTSMATSSSSSIVSTSSSSSSESSASSESSYSSSSASLTSSISSTGSATTVTDSNANTNVNVQVNAQNTNNTMVVGNDSGGSTQPIVNVYPYIASPNVNVTMPAISLNNPSTATVYPSNNTATANPTVYPSNANATANPTLTSSPTYGPHLVLGDSTSSIQTVGPITLKKETDKSEARPGDRVWYTITVTNNSDKQIVGLNLDDTFTSSDIKIVDNGGGLESSGKLQWLNGNLDARQTKTLKYLVQLSPTLTHGYVVHNVATLTSQNLPSTLRATAEVRIMRHMPATGGMRLLPLIGH